MKIQISSLFFLLLLLYSCSSKSSESTNIEAVDYKADDLVKVDTLTIQKRVDVLEEYSSKLSIREFQIKFFEIFPNNFEDFKAIFGYDDNTEEFEHGPLYMSSESYIDVFFTKLDIDKNLFSEKVIDIATGGKWQADGVSAFQIYLAEEVKDDVDYYIEKLAHRNSGEIKAFWYFYFAGPHPENYKKDFSELFSKVNAIDENVGALMKEAYEELLLQSDGHGH